MTFQNSSVITAIAVVSSATSKCTDYKSSLRVKRVWVSLEFDNSEMSVKSCMTNK